MESLYESWAKRNPSWERRYQSTVVDVFCDYGKGVSSFLEARGKIFGAGYEIFIIAFFIGLYHNRTKPLIEDRDMLLSALKNNHIRVYSFAPLTNSKQPVHPLNRRVKQNFSLTGKKYLDF